MSYAAEHRMEMNRPYIKAQRAMLNMTQEELAQHLGMNSKSFSRHLHHGTMPLHAVFAMSDLFKCDVNNLVIRS